MKLDPPVPWTEGCDYRTTCADRREDARGREGVHRRLPSRVLRA
jgi:hypothetical protein